MRRSERLSVRFLFVGCCAWLAQAVAGKQAKHFPALTEDHAVAGVAEAADARSVREFGEGRTAGGVRIIASSNLFKNSGLGAFMFLKYSS